MAQVVDPIARYVGNVAARPHRDLVVLATHMATALLLVLQLLLALLQLLLLS